MYALSSAGCVSAALVMWLTVVVSLCCMIEVSPDADGDRIPRLW
jgi:hypothetical protein